MLEHVLIEPRQPAVASVIWLHGLGADGHDFEPIVPQLNLPANLPIRFIFPHAPLMPVTLNGGYVMPAWFDILSLFPEARVDINGLQRASAFVKEFIEHEKKQGIPSQRIILAGFSQGGSVALYSGLQYPEPLGGILALSTFIPKTFSIPSLSKETPVFMAHGTQDDVIPPSFGETTALQLQKEGVLVEWKTYSMPHSVSQAEIQDISRWMQKILS